MRNGGAGCIQFERGWKDRITGEIKPEVGKPNASSIDHDLVNLGFEKTLNQVLRTISEADWQKEYEGGYFLFLFRSAIQHQIIESAFLLCWTIWEHIFAISNRTWLDSKAIEQMGGDQKVAFILNKYFLKDIDATARRNIIRLRNTRNRLVHFGKKRDDTDSKEMNTFIRLTEQLIAVVLRLQPSNAFNSFEDLNRMLTK